MGTNKNAKLIADEIMAKKALRMNVVGFVKDTNVMLTYTAKQLQKLVFENAYNGYYSKTLYNQFRTQRLIEDTLLRNKMMSKLRDIA